MLSVNSRRASQLLTAVIVAVCFSGCPPAPPAPLETKTFLLPGGVSLEMVYLPSGTFLMGRYPGEQDSTDSQDPQHQVAVPGFWMAKYELTKEQWKAVMGTTPWAGQENVLDDPKSPAVYVSWDDARRFTRALSNYTGTIFRLPSESEWEYACRAGTTTRFYWGDDPAFAEGDDYCWWGYNADEVGESYAHVSGLKLPNAFGLYDMSGNVWEWCHDWYGSDFYRNSGRDNPGGPSSGSYRVLRGGCWNYDAASSRAAIRGRSHPGVRKSFLGFRLALPPGQ